MRLKSYSGSTMNHAMAMVRQDLGENALIISCTEDHKGVRVTAALEDVLPQQACPPKAQRKLKPFLRLLSKQQAPLEMIKQAMVYHSLPKETQEYFLKSFSTQALTTDPLITMGQLFKHMYTFCNINLANFSGPLTLIGPPGVGKTVTLMKFAIEALETERPVKIITTDTLKTGAIDQIRGISELVSLEYGVASTPKELADILAMTHPQDLVLIDTPGINPYAFEEVHYLKELLHVVPAAPFLVLEGRGDYLETIDFCVCFKRLGAAGLMVTKMDTTHRLGTVIAAGSVLKLCRYSTEPLIATNLMSWSPERLAEFFIPAELKI